MVPWADGHRINKGDQLPALKRMHETYRIEAFPQDETLSTFSSTNIYWLFAGEDEGRGEGDSEEPQDGKLARKAPPLDELPPN